MYINLVPQNLLTALFPLDIVEGEDMKKTLLHTRFGTYSIYQENGENSPVQVYHSDQARGKAIGDIVVGSIREIPSKGVTCENGEYVVPDRTPIAQNIRQQAKLYSVKELFNYVVIRDLQGNLRILPQTRRVEDGLETRIRRAGQKPAAC